MNKRWKEKYFGTRDFYLYVLGIVIPMIIQNLITNFVSMLDNIMVGQVGTAQMSGVSIVNQFLFVFNLTVFGHKRNQARTEFARICFAKRIEIFGRKIWN